MYTNDIPLVYRKMKSRNPRFRDFLLPEFYGITLQNITVERVQLLHYAAPV